MAYFTQQRTHSSAYARLFGWALLAPLILGLSANTARAQACIATPPGAIYWLAGDNSFDDQVGFNNGSSQGSGVTFVPGQVGEAMNFEAGELVAVSVTDAEERVQRNSFSFEFWVRPTATMHACAESNSDTCGIGLPWVIFPEHGDNTAPPGEVGLSAGIGIAVGSNGACVGQHSANLASCLARIDTPITDWTHVAVVVENKTPRIYLDGVLAHTGIASSKSFVFASWTIIGMESPFGSFAGDLDELTIYDRALTDDEIAALFAAGSDGKCKPTCVVGHSDDAWQDAEVIEHTPLRSGSSVDCMFGATNCSPEADTTTFAENLPADTVHAVEWQTVAPITLGRFNLWAFHDPDNNKRSFRHVRVQARELGGSFATIYESPIVLPYGQGDQGRELFRCVNVRPVHAQQFRAEFVQSGSAGTFSGVRVAELDGLIHDPIFHDDFD